MPGSRFPDAVPPSRPPPLRLGPRCPAAPILSCPRAGQGGRREREERGREEVVWQVSWVKLLRFSRSFRRILRAGVALVSLVPPAERGEVAGGEGGGGEPTVICPERGQAGACPPGLQHIWVPVGRPLPAGHPLHPSSRRGQLPRGAVYFLCNQPAPASPRAIGGQWQPPHPRKSPRRTCSNVGRSFWFQAHLQHS